MLLTSFSFSLVANVNNNLNNNQNNANKNNINALNQDSNNVASNTNAVNQIMVRVNGVISAPPPLTPRVIDSNMQFFYLSGF